jgi:mRNA interferase RelE/StbE
MIWTLEFETKAKKSLKKLDAIKLVGSESWRIRVGDYRIIYDIQDSFLIITVIKIGHRREVYR